MKRQRIFLSAVMVLLSVPVSYAQVQQSVQPQIDQDARPDFVLKGKSCVPGSETFAKRISSLEEGETVQWCTPDTIITYKTDTFFEKYVYTLDDRGNALCTEYFNYIVGSWVPMQKIVAHYNVWDKIDTTVNYFYQSGTYVPANRKLSTYDERGNHVGLVNQVYDQGSGKFVDENRYTYTYTEQGLSKYSLKQQVSANGGWENLEQWNYSYDADGNQTEYLYDVFGNGRWNSYRYIYSTYEQGRMVEQTCKMINEKGVFGNAYKQIFQYDEKGNDTSYLYQTFDSTGKWANGVMWSKSYTETGKISLYISYIDDNGKWMGQNREEYTYDDRDILSEMEVFRFESYSWGRTALYQYRYNDEEYLEGYQREGLRFDEWVVEKYEFDLDEDGNHTRGQCFRQDNEAWNPVGLYDLEVFYNGRTSSFRASNTPLHRIDISYARGEKTMVEVPPASNQIEREELGARIYPNPVSQVLYVELENDGVSEVCILDMSGRMLHRQVVRGTMLEIPVHTFSGTGQILLYVRQGNASVSRKIVIL